MGPELAINLSEFGYLGSGRKFTSDLEIIEEIKKFPDFEIQLTSQEKMDYGASVPLHLLTKNMPDVKIVSLSFAHDLSLEDHFKLGEYINKVIKNSAKRIALIASGDLSHRLKKTSPAGYSPKGAKFDNKLIEYLNDPETVKENVLNMDANLIKDASECGLKSIVILLGVLSGFVYKPKMLAYQTDLGIGYLTMDFKL
jgi:AmmeMemoRadiSam system protein B